MKRRQLERVIFAATVGFFTLLLCSSEAEARKSRGTAMVFFSWDGEVIDKVADLPNTPEYCDGCGGDDPSAASGEARYLDVCVIYRRVTILFVPVWHYDARWALAIDQGDTYFPVAPEEVPGLSAQVGRPLPEQPPVPTPWLHTALLWFVGIAAGLLVVMTLVAVLLAWLLGDDDNTAEPVEGESAEEALAANGGLLAALGAIFLYSVCKGRSPDDAAMPALDDLARWRVEVQDKLAKHSPTTATEARSTILRAWVANFESLAYAELLDMLRVVRKRTKRAERAVIYQDVADLIGADGVITESEQAWLDLVARTLNLDLMDSALRSDSDDAVEEAREPATASGALEARSRDPGGAEGEDEHRGGDALTAGDADGELTSDGSGSQGTEGGRWREQTLSLNAVCVTCNAILPKGSPAAVAADEGERAVLCPGCLDALRAGR